MLGAAVMLCAARGSGEPDATDKTAKDAKKNPRACKIAYKSAQELELSGHLLQARETYRLCAKITCSAFFKQECSTRYTQLGADIPSVVPIVTTASGQPRQDVRVTMDGSLLASSLDGRAFPIDPGVHEFSFSTDGGVIATQKLTIVAGQRNQPISMAMRSDGRGATRQLTASVAPPASIDAKSDAKTVREKPEVDRLEGEKTSTERPAREKRAQQTTASESPPPIGEEQETVVVQRQGPGVLPYAIGGVGLAGVGAGVLFTLWGRKDNDALAQCTPNCPLDSLDRVKKLYTMADISYGVGLAGIGASALLFVMSGPTVSKEKVPAKSAYMVDVQSTRNGVFGTVSGSILEPVRMRT
jgi:hypothetical protein